MKSSGNSSVTPPASTPCIFSPPRTGPHSCSSHHKPLQPHPTPRTAPHNTPPLSQKTGGSGCGALGSADCCFDNIINGDRFCDVNAFEAPCIIASLTPSPLAAGQTSAPLPVATPAPSLAPVAPTPAPVAAPMAAPVAAPATEAPMSREIEVPTAAPVTEAPVEPAQTPAPTVEGVVVLLCFCFGPCFLHVEQCFWAFCLFRVVSCLVLSCYNTPAASFRWPSCCLLSPA